MSSAAVPPPGGPATGARAGGDTGMPPSTILGVVSRTVLPTVVVFSLYLLTSGHNGPGGGFIGGLVAGAGLVLLWANGGAEQVRVVLPMRPAVLLGLGLLLAQGTAAAGWLLGGQVLRSAQFHLDLPLFGDVKVMTPLFFDTGVYLVVVALIAMVLTTLGAEEPQGAPPAREAQTR